jgi:hypothetical protein
LVNSIVCKKNREDRVMKKIFYGLLYSLLAASLFLPVVTLAGSILQISGEPGVSISLNNEYVGKTTKEENGLILKDIAPGEYSLRAAMQGYNSTETQLVVENDQTIEWRLKYAEPVMNIEDAVKRIDSAMVESKPVGTIILKSIPLNAEVFFNGKSIGSADKKITFAPAADHSVKFVLQKRELSENFSLEPGDTVSLTADFVKGEIVKGAVKADTSLGPAEIKMQTARKKKPALFPHRKHQGMYGCETCHHGTDADGKQTPYAEGMVIQHCVTCHNPKMENKKLSSLMQASHARCKGCHKKLIAEGDAAGPIGKCSGCHIFGEEK